MKLRLAAALMALGAATPAFAGPPYLTDDPVPTDTGHWEICAFSAGEAQRSNVDDESGLDLNYGPVPGVQLTATLPLAFSHNSQDGWRSGTWDVEIGVKYRFFRNEKNGISAAIFPRAILPTSSIASGEKSRILLPIWVGKDFSGGTSLFGGGGYEFNPGPGNRNFWEAALALTHDLNKAVSIDGEIAWQQADSIGGTVQTRARLGSIVKLSDHFGLLVRVVRPLRTTGQAHFYGAVGLFF